MPLLSVANVSFSYSDSPILDGVNLNLEQREHVGLVGRNGCGKSTLLKMIACEGGLRPDSGQIQLAGDITAGYLPQDPDFNTQHTLREEAAAAFDELDRLHQELHQLATDMAEADDETLPRLMKQYERIEREIQASGGFVVDHQIDQVLHGLGLKDEFHHVKTSDLSGGQRGRLALAKLLLAKPDILLLDEPTNHLDIAGRQWLESFLNQYNGAVILISHDRWMLDRVVTKIYELELGKLVEYPGNYRKYRELQFERRLAQQRFYEKQQEHIKREKQFIDRYRAGQRSKQAQGREKRLERFVRNELAESPVEMDQVDIRFKPNRRCGDRVITADNISVKYDTKVLFDHVSIHVRRGDRIGIIGPNGSGKSTLARCLISAIEPDTGRVRPGSQLDIGWYRQTHENLNLTYTVVDHLRHAPPGRTEQEARNLAGAFLFSGNDQDKQLELLSGGERSRVVLAGLVAGGYNLLVLDEPTNHLDIPSAERLEESLQSFTTGGSGYGQDRSIAGTLILITHDRMLLDNLVDQLFILDGTGGFRHFLGRYSEYLETVAAVKSQEQVETQQPQKKAAPPKKKPAGPKRTGKGAGLTQLSQKKLESKIVELENKLAEVDRQLADPEVYRNGDKVKDLRLKRTALQKELSPLEEEWLKRAEG